MVVSIMIVIVFVMLIIIVVGIMKNLGWTVFYEVMMVDAMLGVLKSLIVTMLDQLCL